ncbi:MAG: hypothetical protein WC881_11325, partial [Elusimicrobiota bacterium]
MRSSCRAALALLAACVLILPGPAAAAAVRSGLVRGSAASGMPAMVLRGSAGSWSGLNRSLLSGMRLQTPALPGSRLPMPAVSAAAPRASVALVSSYLLAEPQSPAAAMPAQARLRAAGVWLTQAAAGSAAESGRSAAADKLRWDVFWLSSRAPAEDSASPAGSGPAGRGLRPALAAAPDQSAAERSAAPPPVPRADAKSAVGGGLPAWSLGLGAALLAARVGLPSWLPQLWTHAAPYLSGAGAWFGAYLASNLARRAVTAVGRRANWQPSTLVAMRVVLSLGIWAAGGAIGLHLMGVPAAALGATFGIGGVAMTMAAKDFIVNFLEGV